MYYNYGSGVGSALNRLDTIAASATPTPSQVFAAYTYLGADTIVQIAHPAVTGGLNLTYKGLVDGLYPGFDRFGRVIWQSWMTDDRYNAVDRYFYGYDMDSNITWRAERGPWYTDETPDRDEAYIYDGLGRLVKSVRGVLMGGEPGDLLCPQGGDADMDGDVDLDDYFDWEYGYLNDGTGWELGDFDGNSTVDPDDLCWWEWFWFNPASRTVTNTSEWDLDALGNWAGYREDAGDGTAWDLNQTRITNAANEITSVSGGWITPEYDDAGNMISGPKPGDETTRLHFAYDGWNRLTAVQADDAQNPGQPGAILVAYEYDGQGRRIERTVAGTTEDSYYNESWQVLEVRSNGVVAEQYLWDQTYVDTPVLRWQYDGTNVSTLYYTTDAQHNVTALVSPDGTIVERYMYSPYGEATIYEADWSDTYAESSVANTRLFAGYALDSETGLYDSRRGSGYHDTLGVFISKDPAEVGMHLYQYGDSNPLNRTDPTGLYSESCSSGAYNVSYYFGEGLGDVCGLFNGYVVSSPPSGPTGDAYRDCLIAIANQAQVARLLAGSADSIPKEAWTPELADAVLRDLRSSFPAEGYRLAMLMDQRKYRYAINMARRDALDLGDAWNTMNWLDARRVAEGIGFPSDPGHFDLTDLDILIRNNQRGFGSFARYMMCCGGVEDIQGFTYGVLAVGVLSKPMPAPVRGVAGSLEEATALQARAAELNGMRGGWMARNGSTATARVQNLTTGEVQTWIANESAGAMPGAWGGKLNAGEMFIQGPAHAEQTIVNALGNDFRILSGGTSRNVCIPICQPLLEGQGLQLGGPVFRGMADKTPYRMFWWQP